MRVGVDAGVEGDAGRQRLVHYPDVGRLDLADHVPGGHQLGLLLQLPVAEHGEVVVAAADNLPGVVARGSPHGAAVRLVGRLLLGLELGDPGEHLHGVHAVVVLVPAHRGVVRTLQLLGTLAHCHLQLHLLQRRALLYFKVILYTHNHYLPLLFFKFSGELFVCRVYVECVVQCTELCVKTSQLRWRWPSTLVILLLSMVLVDTPIH